MWCCSTLDNMEVVWLPCTWFFLNSWWCNLQSTVSLNLQFPSSATKTKINNEVRLNMTANISLNSVCCNEIETDKIIIIIKDKITNTLRVCSSEMASN